MTYQHIGSGPNPPQQQAAQAPKRRSTGFALLLGGIGLVIGLVIGCMGGFAIGGTDTDPAAVAGTTRPPAAHSTGAAVVATTGAPPAPAGPATTVDDGTWTVGVDIAPGTYRPITAAGNDCYWAILKSGTNGSDIIENDIGGGRPTVNLKAGQDFTTNRCGTWQKQ